MNARLSEIAAPPLVDFKRKAARIAPAGGRQFDMSQAVPNVPTSPRLRERLADALRNEPDLSFYTDVPGIEPLRAALAATHPLHEGLGADSLIGTAGANQAMLTAFLLHFQAGDRVMLLEPYYFNYDMGLRMLSLMPAYHRLNPADGFTLRAADLIAHLEREPARGVVVITPNNPTGASYASAELLTLLAWTSPGGVEVILDETYAKYDPAHLMDPAIGAYVGRGLTLVGSFSKTYSLTGYRVGYLAAGPAEIEQALKIQDTAVICAPHLSQLAALTGLESCADELAVQLAKTAELGRLFREKVRALEAFALTSCGVFFAYVRHPFTDRTSEEAALELYRHTGILGLPGTVFGEGQQAFIRLAFCNLQPADLDQASDALLAYDATLLADTTLSTGSRTT